MHVLSSMSSMFLTIENRRQQKSNASSKKKQQQLLNNAGKSTLGKGNVLGGSATKSSLLTGDTVGSPAEFQSNAVAKWPVSNSPFEAPSKDTNQQNIDPFSNPAFVSFTLPNDDAPSNKMVQVPRSLTSPLPRDGANALRFWFFSTRESCDTFVTDVFLYLNNVDLFNALLVSTKWKELALSNVSLFPVLPCDTRCFISRARLLY
jgi:hypothetical protein